MIKKIFFLAFILLCFNIFSNADYSTSNDEANVSASDQNFNNLDIGSVFLIIIVGAILFEYFDYFWHKLQAFFFLFFLTCKIPYQTILSGLQFSRQFP